jgi:hypothetical protein
VVESRPAKAFRRGAQRRPSDEHGATDARASKVASPFNRLLIPAIAVTIDSAGRGRASTPIGAPRFGFS